MGTKFGDMENPCLVSVRSGSRVSMPGMMDTVLNLGLNDTVVEGIAKKSGNARFLVLTPSAPFSTKCSKTRLPSR